MSTVARTDALSDLERVCSSEKPDAVLLNRIRERSQKVQDDLRQKLGTVDLAVPLLREARSEA